MPIDLIEVSQTIASLIIQNGQLKKENEQLKKQLAEKSVVKADEHTGRNKKRSDTSGS